ncbi:MAG TPA: metallophosphoesterase family protein, partial [Dehalococcoidia bacterium]
MLIGVVSDTHGYYDARLGPALAGVELILHAGDVGSLEVLARLGEMAPVVAVRGNNDDKVGGLGLPLTQDIEAGGAPIHLVHQLP